MSTQTAGDELFALAVYLVASARDVMDEADVYAPFRLVEGVSRLVGLMGTLDCIPDDAYLLKAKEWIEAEKFKAATDRPAFREWVDELLYDFAKETKRRNLDAVEAAS